jgi:hypothetical protein
VVETPEGVLLVIADGAGGTGSGALAAKFIVDAVQRAAARSLAVLTPHRLLSELDSELVTEGNGGQTTAVVCAVVGSDVFGASVGDSGALLDAGRVDDLTRHQVRKPLLGTGSAQPVPFAGKLSGTLVVATDGLLKYARPDRLRQVAAGPDLAAIPALLVDVVRLRSGALQDDVAVVVCRGR